MGVAPEMISVKHFFTQAKLDHPDQAFGYFLSTDPAVCACGAHRGFSPIQLPFGRLEVLVAALFYPGCSAAGFYGVDRL